MRYNIRHITRYKYQGRVSHCYNVAHMTPRLSLRQQRLNSSIRVSPNFHSANQRRDYFGNLAYHFEIQKPHKELVITSNAEIVTEAQRGDISLEFGISCAEARDLMRSSQDQDTLFAREFLLDSPMITNAPAELKDYAASSFPDDRPLLASVRELTKRIFEDFEYNPAATTVATPLSEVFSNKKGVCQDFAHLQIACLRSLGYPAKYVSGYLETIPPPGQQKLVGSDATHAWLSVYSPREGWFEFDPTNNCVAGEQHIITAWGRDYSDVTPLRGVIFGGGNTPILEISVDVSRVE